jgi:hypothetical protein
MFYSKRNKDELDKLLKALKLTEIELIKIKKENEELKIKLAEFKELNDNYFQDCLET